MRPDNDGGSAFPCKGIPIDPDTYRNHPGMTLRDYFAAKALAGWMASLLPEQPVHEQALAHRMYAIADAMLKARNA